MIRITIDNNQPGVMLEVDSEMKFVEINAIKNIFADNIALKTPLLPMNCIYYQTLNTGNRLLIIAKLKHKRTINTNIRGEIGSTTNVNIPTTILGLIINPINTVIASRIGTLKRYPLSLSETVYSFPLSNVYDTGKVCWGNAEFNGLTISRTHKYLDLFLESEFNGDLEGSSQEINGTRRTLDKIRYLCETPEPDGLFHRTLNLGSFDSTIEGLIGALKTEDK